MRLNSLIFVGGWLMSSCYGAPAPAELTSQADGTSVSLALNQELHLLLETIGPGIYGEPAISSTGIRFEGMTFPSTQKPGGSTQLFKFRAVADTGAVLTIPHNTKPAPFTLLLSCCAQ